MKRKIGGQNSDEWDAFIKYLQDKNVRSYLEVGAREGHALRYLVERIPSIETVVAVDLPGARWGYEDSDKDLEDSLAALSCKTRMILGDSTDADVIAKAKGEYDVVFIDGDHSYEGVLADYTNYGPMGRIVALHDIAAPLRSKAGGVARLWGKIKTDESVEILVSKTAKGIGIC